MKKPIDFEKLHEKINGDFFFLCNKSCAGMCERFYLSYFLPGEDKFIAKKLNMDLDTFRDKYVTVLKFKDGSKINLLKIINPCPFLDTHYHCTLEEAKAKLLACKMYPFCMSIEHDHQYNYLDFHCALVWSKQLPEKFVKETKKAIDELNLPKKWLKNISRLGYFYDYDKLAKLNSKETTYEQIQKCLLS